MSDFYRTTMGHRFYEGTMPALVKQLTRLNDNLERLSEDKVRETIREAMQVWLQRPPP